MKLLQKTLLNEVDRVYAIVSTYDQPLYRELDRFVNKEDVFERATEATFALIEANCIKEKHEKRILILIDDQSTEGHLHDLKHGTFNKLVFNAFHWDISIVVITHGVTCVSPAFREQLEHLIVFKTYNRKHMKILEEEFDLIPSVKNSFRKLYNIVCKAEQRYNFLYICLEGKARFFKCFDQEIIPKVVHLQ